MRLSRTRLGWWVIVVGAAAGCGRISFDAEDARPHGGDAGAALDAGSDAGVAMDASGVTDAASGLDAGVPGDDAGPAPPTDAGMLPGDDAGPAPPADAGATGCPLEGLPASPGLVSGDSFDVVGGAVATFAWVEPGATTISYAQLSPSGSFGATRSIPAAAPSAPRIVRTTSGLAIAWVDASTIRMARVVAGAAATAVTVFDADVAGNPSIAVIGEVVGISWLAAARTPSDLWFATVSATNVVSTPVRLSSSTPGPAPVTAREGAFAVLVPDTGGKQLARFNPLGGLLASTPVVSPTPFVGSALGCPAGTYLAAGNFGFSTYVIPMDVAGTVTGGEVVIPLPADSGGLVDCWQGANARGAWAVPRWSNSTTVGTSTIDVAWLTPTGALSALPRTTIALATPSSQRVVVAAVGVDGYLVAWASFTAPSAELHVRVFCP